MQDKIPTLIQILEHSLKYLYEILHFMYNIMQSMPLTLPIGLASSSCLWHKFTRYLNKCFGKFFHKAQRVSSNYKNYIRIKTLICLITEFVE